jgi:hypothetical protein
MTDEELNEYRILEGKAERKQKMTDAESMRYLALNRRKWDEMSEEEQMEGLQRFYDEDDSITEDPEEEAKRWRAKYEIAAKRRAELDGKTNVEFLRWLAYCEGMDVARLLQIADKLVELDERDQILTALENGGVDNWDWYGASLEDAGL